ncbi:GNAT family N-acetyltransferase [Bacillus sp. Bva_UNVM-123]|uniref:GNAT family N-acetyltransferase n=1 Tax=Bacillus sp. Bva_UNVM-123 TaxID=2829798 RepID=UPI00391F4C4E
MKVIEGTIEEFQDVFQRQNIHLELLNKEDYDVERMVELFKKMDSKYLFPTDNEENLRVYLTKLIRHAYNFVLTSQNNDDIAIISIYANDFKTKTSYSSAIGILPTFRGGNIATNMVKFALKFAKEKGMDYYKAEISKKNASWLRFLERNGFRIKDETENHSYIVIKDLRNDE